MNRRQFNQRVLAGLAGVSVATVGVWKLIENPKALYLSDVLRQLNSLEPELWQSNGAWDTSIVLQHLSQSINYSISGYPQTKSRIFQALVGQSAFTLFAHRKKMTHPLDEPIPGAPVLSRIHASDALNLLKQSILDFQSYAGLLAPHFAYGTLSKAEYDLAHAMHIQQHFGDITHTVSGESLTIWAQSHRN